MTRDTDYFKTFCKISKAFSSAITKQALLDLIVNSAIETMAGKAACLFLHDEKQDVFVPVAQQGLSETYLHANPMKAKRIVGALEKDGFLAFPDATEDPRLENHEVAVFGLPEKDGAGGQFAIRRGEAYFGVAQLVLDGAPVALFQRGLDDPLFRIGEVCDLWHDDLRAHEVGRAAIRAIFAKNSPSY